MGSGSGIRAVWGREKRVNGVSPERPQSFRHQRRPVDDVDTPSPEGRLRVFGEDDAERNVLTAEH